MEQMTHRQKRRSPPDACHRDYHGAPLVELVFRIADWWLEARSRPMRAACSGDLRTSFSSQIRIFDRRR